MRIEGAILPVDDGSRVNQAAWCRLIDSLSEFRRPQPPKDFLMSPVRRSPLLGR